LDKKNILIFPGGTENGIEIYHSLKNVKFINLFSASSHLINHASYIYKHNNIICDVSQKKWVDELNDLIIKNKIDLIYPSNSLIIDALSKEKDKIKAEILLANNRAINITRSKKKTIKMLRGVIPTPKIFNSKDEITSYPVFSKPDNGYGGKDAKIINCENELSGVDFNSNIVQEYLPLKEYTIDCFSDREGKLLFAGPRERNRIRMGTSMHANNVPEDLKAKLIKYAEKILSKIKIEGAWFFQVKENLSNELVLLEIDIRIAGTMCFNWVKGLSFPLLSVYQHYEQPINIMTNDIDISLDRCLKNRYSLSYKYNHVYIDLDDCLIIRNKINLELVTFLYQCINNHIQITLITKSLEHKLEEFLIDKKIFHLFDEIIHLKATEMKARYIKKGSIFIDDSFSQRMSVYENTGVPTFDTSMIELLLNDRY